MFWALIQQVGRQASSYFIFLIIAALLNPEDFGILGMAMTWIAFISIFSEMGFGAALVQRQNIGSDHFSTVFIVNILIGILLMIGGIILSWPAAYFYKTPELQPIMAFLSSSFLINSLSLTQMTIAQIELRFRDLAIRDILATLIGGGMGIIFARLKFGVWSLVIHFLTISVISTGLIWWMSAWRPRLKEFSFQCLKDLWPYSSKIFIFNIFKYFVQNIDKILIGYFLGSYALGIYTFAFRIIVFPINGIIGAIGNYFFIKFSRIQYDLKRLKLYYLYINKTIITLIYPIIIIVAFYAPILISIIFGQYWINAINLVRILTIVAIAQALISPLGQFMKALNRPNWLLNWSIFFTILTSLFIIIGTYNGITGVGSALAIANLIGLGVSYWISTKLFLVSFRHIIKEILPTLLLNSITIFILLIPRFLGLEKNIQVVLLFILLYIFIYIYLIKHLNIELYDFMRRKILHV